MNQRENAGLYWLPKRLPKGRAWKRRVQGVTREWINILDRGITPEPGFLRRNWISFLHAERQEFQTQTIPFRQLFLAISIDHSRKGRLAYG